MRNAPKLPGRRVQLHRAISKLGLGSRTQAQGWIRGGQVTVDGVVVTDPLVWVDLDSQRIAYLGDSSAERESFVLALHKPCGVVTTRSDELGRKTVYDLLPAGLGWVFPAGRLDADSEGLLILTNDSALAEKLTSPEKHVTKTYRVTVSGWPNEEALRRLREGVELSDGVTRPAGVVLVKGAMRRSVIEITLTEGRNRQVRRMCAAVGHKVRRLVRVTIGGLDLGDLAPGECRRLGETEIALLDNQP